MGCILAEDIGVEETILSIRLSNAKRDALDALELLKRCRIEASRTGKSQLAKEIEDLRVEQQRITAALIEMVEGL